MVLCNEGAVDKELKQVLDSELLSIGITRSGRMGGLGNGSKTFFVSVLKSYINNIKTTSDNK